MSAAPASLEERLPNKRWFWEGKWKTIEDKQHVVTFHSISIEISYQGGESSKESCWKQQNGKQTRNSSYLSPSFRISIIGNGNSWRKLLSCVVYLLSPNLTFMRVTMRSLSPNQVFMNERHWEAMTQVVTTVVKNLIEDTNSILRERIIPLEIIDMQ